MSRQVGFFAYFRFRRTYALEWSMSLRNDSPSQDRQALPVVKYVRRYYGFACHSTPHGILLHVA